MFILYGTKGCYQNDVMQKGIIRKTAAYFIIPSAPERDKLSATINCSIYHSIGISTLKDSIYKHDKLSYEIKECGGIYLTVFRTANSQFEMTTREVYVLNGKETYPYVKVRNAGVIPMEFLASVEIEESFFDGYIGNESSGLRFFQKKEGTLQSVNYCNMSKLSGYCNRAALTVVDRITEIIRRKDDSRN